MQCSANRSGLVSACAVLLIAAAALCFAQPNANALLNGGAEDGKDAEPSFWSKAHIPADGLRLFRDTENVHSGEYSLAIFNEHTYEDTVCNNWAQNLQNIAARSVLKVTAYVRAENADNVNICVQCWPATNAKMLAFTSTPVLKGDSDWVLLESPPVLIPENTARVTVRAVLTGLGKAWFDDLCITTLDVSEESTNELSSAQIGDNKYTETRVRDETVDYFFEKIGNPEPGYHGFSGLWALISKAAVSDETTKADIIQKAGTIISDPNETSFRRWQSCYVISGIADAEGIPYLTAALAGDQDETVRSCAACALGKFYDEQAVNALKTARQVETSPDVLNSISKALAGEFQ